MYPAAFVAPDFAAEGVLVVDELDDEHAATTSTEASTSVVPMAALRRTGVSEVRAMRWVRERMKLSRRSPVRRDTDHAPEAFDGV